MNIEEIVKDSLKYPLSNWKSYLILGIIVVFANLYSDIMEFTQDNGLILILWVIGAIMGIFALGYMLKIIKSSFLDVNILPEFNNIVKIFIDGFKAVIVSIVYLIPIIVVILGTLFSGLLKIQAVSGGSFSISGNPIILIIFLYMIVIIPAVALAIANMTYNESKLRSAFKFSEIFEKISAIGRGKLIKWYIVTGILYWIIGAIMLLIYYLFSWINPFFAGITQSLILVPYTYIFVARSVALVYMSENEN